MAITLRTFASGDTDYIAKLNENVSSLTAAINALQAQAGAASAGSVMSAGLLINALFNNADALIGPDSYVPRQNPTTLTVSPGSMYLEETQTVVTGFTEMTANFVGQLADTYYVVVDVGGNITIQDTLVGGAAYSVHWGGSSFSGSPIRIAPVYYDTIESEASRNSSRNGVFHTLDLRLESTEFSASNALAFAQAAKTKADQLESAIFAAAIYTIRKVGITVDGTTGIKGIIQLDFGGEILGWSIIADKVGSIQVEIDRKASSPPPAAPSIPTGTDSITGSAPITLNNAQSASVGEGGLSNSWTKLIQQWDVLQFNVLSVATITRATLYIRIREIPPLQGVGGVTITSTEVLYLPVVVLQTP